MLMDPNEPKRNVKLAATVANSITCLTLYNE